VKCEKCDIICLLILLHHIWTYNNMKRQVYTFSIKENDNSTIKLVEELKLECETTGVSFSFVVLKALKMYNEAMKNVKTK